MVFDYKKHSEQKKKDLQQEGEQLIGKKQQAESLLVQINRRIEQINGSLSTIEELLSKKCEPAPKVT